MAAHPRRSFERTPQRSAPQSPASGDTFLIVVEGEATELRYLKAVRSRLGLKAAAVHVSHGKHTDPVGIVRDAVLRRDEQLELAGGSFPAAAYDQTWVVFDREVHGHPRRRQVPAALRLAEQEKIFVGLSIPSFEYWLLLHYCYTTKLMADCNAVIRELKHHIPKYQKGDFPMDALLLRSQTAMEHADRCTTHWEGGGGDRNPWTGMHTLLHALNQSARSASRLF